MVEEKRYNWIDYAKTLGIFFVLLGHLQIPHTLEYYIFSFHMPLFFFLSGFLYKSRDNYKNFFMKKTKSLLFPYIFFSVLSLAFYFLVAKNYGNDSNLNLSIWHPIIGVLYGNGINNYLIHNIALWFLPCLFCTELLFFTLIRFFKSNIVIAPICICLSFFQIFIWNKNWVRLPFSLNVSLIALIFYYSGYLIKNIPFKFKFNNIILSILAILLLLLTFYLSQLNGRIDLNSLTIKNPIYFLLNAFLGTLFICILSTLLSNVLGYIAIVKIISENTLTIFALHLLVFTLIKGVIIILLKLPLELWTSVYFNICIALIDMSILLIVAKLLEKKLPVAIGKI